LAGAVALAARTAAGAATIYDVREFGAKGDGKTLCTQAIQAAIDKCATDGGGTVWLPAGTWLSGTIYLESRVALMLDSGSTLLGSKDPKDYAGPRKPLGAAAEGEQRGIWSLIAGRNLEHVAICGRGTIDGQGSAFRWTDRSRPMGIHLIECRDVLIEGVRMRNAGSWMQHYEKCDGAVIRGISVFNHAAYNNDGLDVSSSSDVKISDCTVDSDDDAIVLKSMSSRPCENVTITNCVVSSHCNAIKMGTESGGGFQNITVSNCTVCSPRYTKATYGRDRGLAGIALEIVDGGEMNRVTVSNIAIKGVTVPIFVRLGDRARAYDRAPGKPTVGTLRNVILSDIVATSCSSIGCSITGLPGHPVENVALSNINLTFDGGGARERASAAIPEKETAYPESTMFGELPAYAFFCRHVKGLTLNNIQIRTSKSDLRHAAVLDDVANAQITALDAGFSPNAAAMIRATDVSGLFIRGCRPRAETGTFLQIAGAKTDGIVLSGNDLRGVSASVTAAPEVSKTAVVDRFNIAREDR
jgi:polygalacturonase